jgi:hypothetical protein
MTEQILLRAAGVLLVAVAIMWIGKHDHCYPQMCAGDPTVNTTQGDF